MYESVKSNRYGTVIDGRIYFSSPWKHFEWVIDTLTANHKEFFYSSIFCSDEAGLHIATALSKNVSMKEFGLHFGLMTDESAIAFANALKNHPTLECFQCSGQFITAEGAAEIIRTAKVKSLDLSYNQITDENFDLLCQAIEINTKLNRLDLSSLRINSANIDLLKKALQENGRISSFSWGFGDSAERGPLQEDRDEIKMICASNYCRTEPVDQIFQNFHDILEEHWDDALSEEVCSALNANPGLQPLNRPLTREDLYVLVRSFINRDVRGDLAWLYTRGSAVQDLKNEDYPILAYRNGHLAQDKTLRERLLAPQCSMTELYATILEDYAYSSSEESDTDSEQESDYVYTRPVVAKSSFKPSEVDFEGLSVLSKKLERGQQVDYDQAPAARFPFFRGIHYLRNYFSRQKRKAYRDTDHRGEPIFSSAVRDLATQEGVTPDDNARYEVLADEVKQVITDLNEAEVTTKLSPSGKGEARRHPTPRAAFQELYTNNYQGIHALLEKEDKPVVLKSFRSVYNPQVSTSEEAKHAAKYSFGAKAFGKNDQYLRPHYRTQLRPKHPYLGKVTVILVPMADIEELDPAFVVKMHHDFEVSISHHYSNNILVEREVSFPGWIPGQYVKFEMNVRVPNFSHSYKAFHRQKYGLSKIEYLNLQQELREAGARFRRQEEFLKKLFEKLVPHYQLQLEVIAKNIADGHLVYRGLKGGIQATPPDIEKAKSNHDELKRKAKPTAADERKLMVVENIEGEEDTDTKMSSSPPTSPSNRGTPRSISEATSNEPRALTATPAAAGSASGYATKTREDCTGGLGRP